MHLYKVNACLGMIETRMSSVGSSVKGYWQVNGCPEEEESLFWLR